MKIFSLDKTEIFLPLPSSPFWSLVPIYISRVEKGSARVCCLAWETRFQVTNRIFLELHFFAANKKYPSII